MLKVVAVAILAEDGTVFQMPPPYRHHNIIRMMSDQGRSKRDMWDQGFVLSDGTYADRIEAKKIAVAANQLLERASKLNELFSECVW